MAIVYQLYPPAIEEQYKSRRTVLMMILYNNISV